MAQHDIVVAGASSGGIEALQTLVRSLPPDLPAAVFVVLHLYSRASTILPEILGRVCPLPVAHPKDGDPILTGRVYVAPPDHHLMLEHGFVRLAKGPKENFQRPCINVTFRSAAQAYRERVVGVVLTGQLDDGAAGLWDVKRQGGVAIVQDPDEAAFPSMPQSALRGVQVDYRLPLTEIGPLLATLAQRDEAFAPPVPVPVPADGHMESQVAHFSCPECGGVTREEENGSLLEYRCRVGHTFSPKTMLSEYAVAQERALWAAILSLEEGAELALRVGQKLEPELRERLMIEVREGRQHAQTIRNILTERTVFSLD